jgi:hypothetical protein
LRPNIIVIIIIIIIIMCAPHGIPLDRAPRPYAVRSLLLWLNRVGHLREKPFRQTNKKKKKTEKKRMAKTYF